MRIKPYIKFYKDVNGTWWLGQKEKEELIKGWLDWREEEINQRRKRNEN